MAYYENIRKKEKEKWLEKGIVKDTHFHVDGFERKKPDPFQLNKGMLQGTPKRPGLMLPRTRVKYARIPMTRKVEAPPMTIFTKLDEAPRRPGYLYCLKRK